MGIDALHGAVDDSARQPNPGRCPTYRGGNSVHGLGAATNRCLRRIDTSECVITTGDEPRVTDPGGLLRRPSDAAIFSISFRGDGTQETDRPCPECDL